MALRYDDLKIEADEAAVACIKHCESQGSVDVMVYSHDDYRIIRSIDPSGDNGEMEWHVSVSRNQQPVSVGVFLTYATLLVPSANAWKHYKLSLATHGFSEVRDLEDIAKNCPILER